MTPERDPDVLIHHFLLEGRERLQDQVYDEVRARIELRPQRVVIGPWRMPNMNRYVPIGLAAAVIVVALVVGSQLLGPAAPGGVGAAPTAAPTATADPTPAPTPTPTAAATRQPTGGLPEGPFVLLDGMRDDGTQGVAITVTIPAAGWDGEPGGAILERLPIGADPPDGAGLIVFADGPGWYVPDDPCGWVSTMPEARATTVDALVAALAGQGSRDASEPVDITVGGYAGKAVTLHTPAELVDANCDQGRFCTFGDPEHPDPSDPSDTCYRYGQGPGQIDNLWVLDVDGQLVVIDWTHYAATPGEAVAEERAIVESATFE